MRPPNCKVKVVSTGRGEESSGKAARTVARLIPLPSRNPPSGGTAVKVMNGVTVSLSMITTCEPGPTAVIRNGSPSRGETAVPDREMASYTTWPATRATPSATLSSTIVNHREVEAQAPSAGISRRRFSAATGW